MRFLTFQHGRRTSAGLEVGDFVIDLGTAFFRAFRRPFRFPDLGALLEGGHQERVGELDLPALRRDREVCLPRREVKLRAPLLRPPKIVCVGLNYRSHAEEQNVEPPPRPTLFAKAPNVVIGPDEPIEIPVGLSEQVDYEVELAVVIGRPGFRIPRERAAEHVFGYTILNDVTARDLQRGDRQWFRGKSLKSFAPLGPAVVTRDAFDPSAAEISLSVNGEVRQKASTAELLFDVPYLIEYASVCFPLEAGDVLSTGTPAGVAMAMKPPRWLRAGDRVEARIAGIGTLANPVR